MYRTADDDEKLSFGKEIHKQSQYGTSSKHALKLETYIKHAVVPTDTLQGLSLKYDVSIEQIKRVNNLWTNDSLFLKPFLLIPSNSKDDNLVDFSTTSCKSDVQLPYLSSCVRGAANRPQRLGRHTSEDCQLIVGDIDVEVKPDEKIDFKEYFSKIDSRIQVAKENVTKLEEKTRSADQN